jgi:hypothetical protein
MSYDIVQMLEKVPDQALQGMMKAPDGMAPGYLVASELQRRQQLRQQAQQVMAKAQVQQAPPTVAQGILQGGMKAPLQEGAEPAGIAALPGVQSGLMAPKPPNAPQPAMPMQTSMGLERGGRANFDEGGSNKKKKEDMDTILPGVSLSGIGSGIGNFLSSVPGMAMQLYSGQHPAPAQLQSMPSSNAPSYDEINQGLNAGLPSQPSVAALSQPTPQSTPQPTPSVDLPPLTGFGANAPKAPPPDDNGDDDNEATPARKSKYTPATIAAKPLDQFMADAKAAYGDDPTQALADKINAMGDDLDADKNRALNMALIRAGLGMATSKSPGLLTALSEGAQQGLTQYGSDIDKAREQQNKAVALQAQLAAAQQARQAGLANFGSQLQNRDISVQEANDKAQFQAEQLAQQEELKRLSLTQANDLKKMSLNLEAQKFGLNGNNEPTPQEKLAGEAAAAGDPRLISTLGMGPIGTASKQRAMGYAAQLISENGGDGKSWLASHAGVLSGNAEASALGRRSAQLDPLAVEASGMADNVRANLQNIDNSNFVPWNKLKNMGLETIGDPNLRALKQSLTGLEGIAATMMGKGTISDSRFNAIKKNLDESDSPAALDAALKQIQIETGIVTKAPHTILENVKSDLSGRQPNPVALTGFGVNKPKVLVYDANGNPVQ